MVFKTVARFKVKKKNRGYPQKNKIVAPLNKNHGISVLQTQIEKQNQTLWFSKPLAFERHGIVTKLSHLYDWNKCIRLLAV